MKRSEVNTIIREADAFVKSFQFHLPPFAYWTPEDWRKKGPEAKEIADHKLGWDVTDMGQGRYHELGLTLFTIRNGAPENLKSGRGKTYAEKLLIVGVNQITPFHFHWQKTEDIINRGGGKLRIQLYNSTPDEKLEEGSEVTVSLDGVVHTLPAGSIVTLLPGESITLPTGLYHKFWAEEERVLCGEVSTVNDDLTDNCFLDALGRFSDIEEDEPPLYLLVGDYGTYYLYAD
ncbi:MAG: D-lyxose/D-mannose family sugar isomerase [Anaerolineae bacterium]|nr:D-lyxose/D-mannose family sugar isomerase [Anaerolineae bacterium]